jgi:hypothetical protein
MACGAVHDGDKRNRVAVVLLPQREKKEPSVR